MVGQVKPIQDGSSGYPERTVALSPQPAPEVLIFNHTGSGGSRSRGKPHSCGFGPAPQGGGAPQQGHIMQPCSQSLGSLHCAFATPPYPEGRTLKSHPGPCLHLRQQMRPAPVESPSKGRCSNLIPSPEVPDVCTSREAGQEGSGSVPRCWLGGGPGAAGMSKTSLGWMLGGARLAGGPCWGPAHSAGLSVKREEGLHQKPGCMGEKAQPPGPSRCGAQRTLKTRQGRSEAYTCPGQSGLQQTGQALSPRP